MVNNNNKEGVYLEVVNNNKEGVYLVEVNNNKHREEYFKEEISKINRGELCNIIQIWSRIAIYNSCKIILKQILMNLEKLIKS